MLHRIVLTVGLLLSGFAIAADNTTGMLTTFLQKNFKQPPQSATLWLKPALKQRAEQILQHPYQGMRIKYWQAGNRTAWIIDEIGKEQPITTGVVIDDGKIVAVDVLTYRESRGGEVQQSFFTRQFQGANLTADDGLNKKIDGITGATLSVAALQKTARLALLFDAAKAATP